MTSPFCDDAIKELLFDRRNLEPLEDLISAEESKLKESGVPSFDANAERIPPIKEVREKIFPELKEGVNRILEFSEYLGVPVLYCKNPTRLKVRGEPAIACYNGLIKAIKITNIPFKNLVRALSHEYVHAIQDYKKYLFLQEKVFREGLACGVEDCLIENSFPRELFTHSRYNVVQRRTNFLNEVYLFICSNLDVSPKKISQESLNLWQALNHPSPFRDVLNKTYLANSSHQLGTAFFALSELKHGPSVYARALRRDEGILELH